MLTPPSLPAERQLPSAYQRGMFDLNMDGDERLYFVDALRACSDQRREPTRTKNTYLRHTSSSRPSLRLLPRGVHGDWGMSDLLTLARPHYGC